MLRGRRVAVVNWRDPAHSLAGGAERYAWEFAQGLVTAGAQVDFVTARDTGQLRHEEIDRINVVRRGGQFTFYAWALWWLLRHRCRLDAVVDADCGIPVYSPLVLSRRRTAIVLLVHHVHLDQFGTYFPGPVAWLGRLLEGWVMPHLYRGLTTVAVSASTLEEMRERLGWTGPVQLVHNGNAARARTSSGQHGQLDRVVSLGRLVPHKRVDQIVRAVDLLRKSRPGLRLHVVGKGPEHASLRVLVQELGLQRHVWLHGFLEAEAKEALVASSALHVSASDSEGWGQVVIEAASLGVPTVARDVPGLRDSIRDGATGWLIEEPEAGLADLPQRLADAIDAGLAELADPGRQEEVSRACRRWGARFSWEQMHEAAVGVVAGAIEGGA
jgi:glycosyltransferase involved in cell wall biosynthesis